MRGSSSSDAEFWRYGWGSRFFSRMGCALFVCLTAGGAGAGSPNIVLIMADDLGWRDVGFHGSTIETPHIDRIAREGIVLDRFYVQPVCSPTRAAVMTGKSSARLGVVQPISKLDPAGLPVGEKILPQFLAAQG